VNFGRYISEKNAPTPKNIAQMAKFRQEGSKECSKQESHFIM
jgi:hypothetical protein